MVSGATGVTTADGYELWTPYDPSSVAARSLVAAASSAAVNDKWGKAKDTRGDILFDKRELIRFFAELGVPLTESEAVVLIRLFGRGEGDGNIINKNFVLNDIVNSGLLTPKLSDTGRLYWEKDWDAAPVQDVIAQAIVRLGLDDSGPTVAADGTTGLTAKQYERGVDRLFGDTDPVDRGKAEEVVRVYGSGGVISVEQIRETIDVTPRDGHYDSAPIKLSNPEERDFWPLRYDRITLPPPDHRVDPVSGLTSQQTHMVKYLMSFAGDDGRLSRSEFEKGVKSLLGHGVKLEGHMVDFYMQVYAGKYDDGAFLTQADVTEMMRDTTLGASPLTDLEGETRHGFNINGNIVKLTKMMVRWVPGIDPPKELQSLFRAMGLGDVSVEQARFLIKVYGTPDGKMNEAGFTAMLQDGVFLGPVDPKTNLPTALTTDAYLADLRGIDWNKISGTRIAEALYRELGLDPAQDRLTAAQFQQGLKGLFHYETDAKTVVIPTEFSGSAVKESKPSSGRLPVDDRDAAFLVRYASEFGVNPTTGAIERTGVPDTTIGAAGIAQIFDTGLIQIGVGQTGPQKWVAISDHHETAFTSPVDVVEFLKTFDANGDGKLDAREWAKARDALPTQGLDDRNRKFDRLMAIHGGRFDAAQGGHEGIPLAVLQSMVGAGVLALGEGGRITVDLGNLPRDMMIEALFRYWGKDPARDRLTAEEFGKAAKHVFGDWQAIENPQDWRYLVQAYGDGKTLSFESLQHVFMCELRIDGPGRKDIIKIRNDIDRKDPAYKDIDRWYNGFSLSPAATAEIAETIAGMLGLMAPEVAAILAGATWLSSHPDTVKAVMDKVVGILKSAGELGGTLVMGLIDALTGSLLADPALTADGKAYLEKARQDLLAGGEAAATFFKDLLTTAKDKATAAVNKVATLNRLAGLDMGKLLASEGITGETVARMVDSLLAEMSIFDPETGKEAVGARRRVLGLMKLKTDNGESYAFAPLEFQFVRLIPGAQINLKDGTFSLNNYQFRPMFQVTDVDPKTGAISWDFRFRLQEVSGLQGVFLEGKGSGLDGGLLSESDLIFGFKDSTFSSVTYSHTLQLVGRLTIALKDLYSGNAADPTRAEAWLRGVADSFGVTLPPDPEVGPQNAAGTGAATTEAAMGAPRTSPRLQAWTQAYTARTGSPPTASEMASANRLMLAQDALSKLAATGSDAVKQGASAAVRTISAALYYMTYGARVAKHLDIEGSYGSGTTYSFPIWSKDAKDPNGKPKASAVNAVALPLVVMAGAAGYQGMKLFVDPTGPLGTTLHHSGAQAFQHYAASHLQAIFERYGLPAQATASSGYSVAFRLSTQKYLPGVPESWGGSPTGNNKEGWAWKPRMRFQINFDMPKPAADAPPAPPPSPPAQSPLGSFGYGGSPGAYGASPQGATP